MPHAAAPFDQISNIAFPLHIRAVVARFSWQVYEKIHISNAPVLLAPPHCPA
jgi:hypothetical protein